MRWLAPFLVAAFLVAAFLVAALPALASAQAVVRPREDLDRPVRGLGEVLDAPSVALDRPAAAPPAPPAYVPPPELDRRADACWDRGDNECVVAALFGRTLDERGLYRLATSLRARRDGRAFSVMAELVARFPTSPRAAGYRRILARDED